MSILKLAALFLAGATLSACNASSGIQTSGFGNQPSANASNLTPAGASFTVSMGQTFQVVLPSAGAGGYQWHLDSSYDTGVVAFVGEQAGSLPANPTPGQFAPEVFVFRGQASGATTLHFSQYRSWEGPSQANATAMHAVMVQ